MEDNLLKSWSPGQELDAEKLIESDLPMSEIRNKIDSLNKGAKIDLAYRLAISTTNRQNSNDMSSSKLDTVITRTVKLIRLYERAKENRGYTQVEG
jgi:hypothetical protein